MGKALRFSGVTVDAPLQTVTFVRELITANDYVSAYKQAVGGLTAKQESSLLTFIETLMTNGIWDKVNYFFPLIKGVDYQSYDLKSVKKIGFIARTPSYSEDKDCLHIGYNGLATCITADINININDMTSIISYSGSCNFFSPVSLGIANKQEDYIRFGGNQKLKETFWYRQYPTINSGKVAVLNDTGEQSSWSGTEPATVNFVVSLSIQSNLASSKLYNVDKQRKYSKDNVSFEFDESYRDLEKFPLKLGGYYGVESSYQPVEADLYCILLSSKLSEQELIIATKAINKLNNDLGRYSGELVE